MLRILEKISYRMYKADIDIEACEDGYRLSDGTEVIFEAGSWLDQKGHEYTSVAIPSTDGNRSIISFVQRDTLSEAEKRLLSKDTAGTAYVRYNELIGGESISMPSSYPVEIQSYLNEGHTIEEIYEECIEAGITWYERFSIYPVEDNPELIERVMW